MLSSGNAGSLTKTTQSISRENFTEQAKILRSPGLCLCYRQETQEVSLKPPNQFLEKISFA